jgi:glycosyltransferase involved in cell wall biosynthesis
VAKGERILIKVAFWYDRPEEYTGGINYLKNLLYALSKQEKKEIDPYIFFGSNLSQDTEKLFLPLAKVVRTSVLDRKSFLWLLNKIFLKFFGSTIIVELVVKRHQISVISHPENVYGNNRGIKIISWIPDFQFLHLPELFPRLTIESESKRIRDIVNQTDALILSSYTALTDYKKISPNLDISNLIVLQFVSQPQQKDNKPTLIELKRIQKKYKFNPPYLFLPNQFWKHKNHMVAFVAMKRLKELGVDISLVCTGNLIDYRFSGTSYVDGLLEYISENNLTDYIKILGAIDYQEVLVLMEHSEALLNPSRFEGWSSTVEEAKSMGKKIILSDIPTHLEQSPIGGYYFECNSEESLVNTILRCISDEAPSYENTELDLEKRTKNYGQKYVEFVMKIVCP